MIYRKPHLLLVIAIGLINIGCDKKPAEPAQISATEIISPVVAEINGDVIRQGDLDTQLQQRKQEALMTHQQEPDRQQVLSEMVDSVLLMQYAKSTKIDQDPEVRAVLKRTQADILQQAVRHRLLRDKPIASEEITARAKTLDAGKPNKPVKNDQFMADQRLRAQAYREIQDERIGGLMKELRGQAKVVVK